MSLPYISCVCPTYGRPPSHTRLLEECVESFLRQDYTGPKELIILNDCASQILNCSSPDVRVVNIPKRVPNLGGKYNLLVNLSRGAVIVPWEDDDISLPGRISQAVDRLSDGLGYFNPQATWFMNGGGLHHVHTHGVCHNASAYTREAWMLAGGYPAVSGAQDMLFDSSLKRTVKVGIPLSVGEPETWTYIYCWGRSPCHLSGFPDHEKGWQEVGVQGGRPGTYDISPSYYTDYEGLVSRHLREARVNSTAD
jgi:glycosyltransferase involved in cell wall biosynthesis